MMHHRVHATATSGTSTILSSVEHLNGDSSSNNISNGNNSVKNSSSVNSVGSILGPAAAAQQQRRRLRKAASTTRKSIRNKRNSTCSNDEVLGWVLCVCVGLSLLALGVWVGTRIANGTFFPSPTQKLHRGGGESGLQGAAHPDDVDDLPFNPRYRIPGGHPKVGDRSDRYTKVREAYEESHGSDTRRSLEFVKQLQRDSDYQYDIYPIPEPHEIMSYNDNNDESYKQKRDEEEEYSHYDVYNCPENPPEGYPFQWNVLEVLANWPANDIDTKPPPEKRVIYQGLCVFDFATDYAKATTYREMELPFVVKNDPQIAETVERWNTPGYMENMLGDARHRTEYSKSNRFLFSSPKAVDEATRRRRKNNNNGGEPERGRNKLTIPERWKPPTELLRMPYKDWLEHANTTNDDDEQKKVAFDAPHWYYRLIGCGLMGNRGECDEGSSEYLFDELPFFQPRNDLLYVADPSEQRGIHCRFGMDGVIAENHFDGSRNTIAVFRGSRRYILGHPRGCENFALYPADHPSARHSRIDWTTQPENATELHRYPEFADALVNEIVLQAGDALYLPSHWFHYIVSLELNYQCNTRSGVSYEYLDAIQRCGFRE